MNRVLQPEQGDVLLNSTGTGTIGRSSVFDAEGDFIVDGHVTTLRPRQNRAIGTWLNGVLRSQWGQLFLETQCYSGSTNQVELSRTRLACGLVPTPPLPEQRLIAEILDTLDEAIRKTEQLIAKLKLVKQGLLHDLLTRGIDENGELRDPERHPEQFKDSPLGRIPREWEVGSLKTCLLDIRYGTSAPALGDPEDVPILRIPNVQGGNLDLTDLKYVKPSVSDRERYSVSEEDILVVRTNGNPDLLGRCACIVGCSCPLMFASYLIRLRIDRSLASPHFVASFINSRQGRQHIEKHAATSAGNYNLNTKHLRQLPLFLPPLPEQLEIVEQHRFQNDRIEREICFAAKLHLLKAGLMDDLLTGRVRVAPLLEGER